MNLDKELVRQALGGIETLVRRYGYEPSSNKMIQCLFHEDTHASMSIAREFGYCFSCGAKTDEFGAI